MINPVFGNIVIAMLRHAAHNKSIMGAYEVVFTAPPRSGEGHIVLPSLSVRTF